MGWGVNVAYHAYGFFHRAAGMPNLQVAVTNANIIDSYKHNRRREKPRAIFVYDNVCCLLEQIYLKSEAVDPIPSHENCYWNICPQL